MPETPPPRPGLRQRLRTAARESVGGLPATFWWLWTSTLVNRLGGFVVTFLALYLTVDRGLSPAFAGLVASLYGLGGSLASVAGGVLADRIGRRPTLLAAQAATATATLALGLVHPAWAIAVTAAVLGFTSNASRPAVSAIMADLVPAADRVRAFSLNYWAINIGFAFAAAAAGLIAAHGFLLLFVGDAATTLLCALVVFARVPETRPEAAPVTASAPAPAAPRVGLVTVLRDPAFMALVGLTFLLACVANQGGVALPIVMGRAGYSPTDYGLVVALNGLLIVLLQIPVTRFVQGRNRALMLSVAALCTGCGFGLTAFAGSAWFYALTVTVWTAGEMLSVPANMALVAELSPVHARGRYQGVYSLAWSGASFLAPMTAGFLLTASGGDAVWLCCTLLGLVAAAGYVRLLRERPQPRLVPLAARPAVAAAGNADARSASTSQGARHGDRNDTQRRRRHRDQGGGGRRAR
ncbi:MFS transporter [Streptacidiphilus sp. P02-A3a]|uniref:MDR family MFS transporter n=1 Tax=Streptacidiphilus sp. P02-A3a TaxID=2704468 RepID=UPI001CDB4DEB|nr:MFS transporter [Streptacidiphilus sp. P02-A3a]